MVEGMKIARSIVEGAPMDRFRSHELAPGPDCRSDVTEASATRRPRRPRTRKDGSVTAPGSVPIRVVPQTEEDRRAMVEGMKIARSIVEGAPMDRFRSHELARRRGSIRGIPAAVASRRPSCRARGRACARRRWRSWR
jgi:hypothetical protein